MNRREFLLAGSSLAIVAATGISSAATSANSALLANQVYDVFAIWNGTAWDMVSKPWNGSHHRGYSMIKTEYGLGSESGYYVGSVRTDESRSLQTFQPTKWHSYVLPGQTT